jgi:hypothetical protein
MKIQSSLHAGDYCPGPWARGYVEKIDWSGKYGQVRGQDNLIHFFNPGYTVFYPQGARFTLGQAASYSPFLPPDSKAGKAACLTATPPQG